MSMGRLLKVVAGGNVEGGDGEKTNAYCQQNRIKHIDLLRVPGRVSTPPGSSSRSSCYPSQRVQVSDK